MRRLLLGLSVCTILLGAAAARAAVNCDQVRRYAATGRSPEDIAESMIVDVNEVKKCLAGDAAKQAPTPGAKDAQQK